MLKNFQETTKTWRSQPAFKRVVFSRGTNAIAGEVSTTNKIYGYVSNGTKTHFIAPRRVRALRFRSGYTAKTSSRRISARSGGRSGPFVYSRGHIVKGIRPRKFDTQIKKLLEPRFFEIMANSMEDAILEVS